MAATRGRDTTPELKIRSAAHRIGLRFRVCCRPLPAVRRTADLLFPGQRLAVFVDGCFWHGCPEHGVAPHTNMAFWTTKLARNTERDRETDRLLRGAGWIVLRIWEHVDPDEAVRTIGRAVTALREEASRSKGG